MTDEEKLNEISLLLRLHVGDKQDLIEKINNILNA